MNEQIVREIDVANDARKAIEAGAPVQFAPGKEKTQFAKRWASTPGATDAEKLEAIVADAKYLDSAIEDIKKFDNFLAGSGVPTSSRDVLRSLGEVAAIDKDIAAKAAAALETKKGTDALFELVKTDNDVANAVRKQIVSKKSLQEVYKNTSDVNAFDNYVRVTKNTWASPAETQKLMKGFAGSDFGKAVSDMNKLPTTYGKTARRPTFIGGVTSPGQVPYAARVTSPGVKLDDATGKIVLSEVRRQQQFGKLPVTYFPVVDNFISYKDLRTLIDNNIDLGAAASKNAVTTEAVSRLAPRQALQTTVPVEMRSFNHQTFKDIFDKLSSVAGVNTPTYLKLNPTQRGLINEVTSKMSKIDVKLRNDIKKVMSDTAFREALTGSPLPITRSEALAHLTFPKGADIKSVDINRVLTDMSNSMLTTAGYKEDIFDVFSGLSLKRATDIWSTEGRALVDAAIARATPAIMKDPTVLWTQMRSLHDELATLATDAKNLKDPNTKVIDIVKNSGADVLPSELMVGTYYRAEAMRAVDDSLRNIVASEDLEQPLSRLSSEGLLSLGKNAEAKFKYIVTERLKSIVSDPNILKSSSVIDTGVLRAFGLDESRRVSSEVLAFADDYAKQIFNANDLKYSNNITEQILDIRKSLDNADVYERAKIVLGNDIAAQLKSAFASSGSGTIETNIAEALRKYAGEGTIERASRLLSSALSTLLDLFYTSVLTLAPRFHMGNMLGAPALIYATTGKLPSPWSLVQASAIVGRSGTSLGDVSRLPGGAIIDAAGRKYTPNELWEAFSTRTGESTSSLGLAGVQSRAVEAELAGGKLGPVSRGITIFKNTPTTEDLIWRMTVGIDALKQGRSLDDATELGRKALFDTGDITSAEKKIQSATMFYSFARNNFVNLIKNMTDPTFFKRIVKIGATKRGAEGLVLDWNTSDEDKDRLKKIKELQAFAPTSTDTRIILGLAKPIDGKPVYIGTASDATLSALDMFGNILAGGGSEIVGNMLRPETKALLNIDDARDLTEVPAEQAWWLQSISDATGVPMDELIGYLVTPASKLVEGKFDTIKPTKKEDGTLKYPLVDPIQQKTYTDRIAVLNYLGLMRIAGDIPNSFGAPGTKVTLSDVEPLLYALNLNTPLKGQSPMMQRAKNVILLDKEAASWARDLSNKAIEDVKTVLPATTAEKREQDIRFAKTEAITQKKAEKVLTLDAVRAQMDALANESDKLVDRVVSGEITKAQAKARLKQIKTELADLKVKKAALQAGETPK